MKGRRIKRKGRKGGSEGRREKYRKGRKGEREGVRGEGRSTGRGGRERSDDRVKERRR